MSSSLVLMFPKLYNVSNVSSPKGFLHNVTEQVLLEEFS